MSNDRNVNVTNALLPVGWATSTTCTRTQVASAAADTLIIAANANRRKIIITNTDANILRLACGTAAATAANYTVALSTSESYIDDDYDGQIRGIWDANGAGDAAISEFTA